MKSALKTSNVKVLFLEPFYGGSHRDFAEGLATHSRFRIELATLPARFWKWRMRGAALHFAKRVSRPEQYDCLITSGLMSLADLKAIWGETCPPAIVYFHENQLSYPLAPGERMDYQFGFTNLSTCLAADRVIFNSKFHLETFLEALPGFLKMMPDCRPQWVVNRIREKSSVIHPGCRFPAGKTELRPLSGTEPPLIIWNHRWEFDKAPEDFFNALDHIVSRGIDFRLALLGEGFEKTPSVFREAKRKFADKIVRYGFVESKRDYFEWLRRGTLIVGTAIQENFGIAVVEAVRCGCIPLLPNRLAYPEVIPEKYHSLCLYADHEKLIDKLASLLKCPLSFTEIREDLSSAMGQYAWENVINRYDDLMEQSAERRKTSNGFRRLP